MNETRQLVKFVAETTFEDLPQEVVERIKIYVVDSIACGFVGSVQPWSRMVADMVREACGKEEASMFNESWKTDISRAALVNGAMIGAFEVEHVGHVAHPSAQVFPAALATAEREHTDGRTFITAMALGYETVCRIGEAMTRAVEDERGFHNPAVNGPFGAAASAGRLLGLDEAALLNAMGIAGSHAGGLTEFVWEGAMTKRLHLGRASQLGLESVLLAQKGFTGPSTVLEGTYGFFHAFSPNPSLEKLLENLGEEWLTLTMMIKAYGCHATGQAIVHAIQGFKKQHPLHAKTVKWVRITGLGGGPSGNAMEERFQGREPANILGGQYSLPFTTAVAISRDMSNPLVFSEETLWDPYVRELALRVEIEEHGSGPEVIIDVDGESHVIEVGDFPGSLRHPLSFDEVCHKFRRYTQTVVELKRGEKILKLVEHLEQLSDMALLARLLQAPE